MAKYTKKIGAEITKKTVISYSDEDHQPAFERFAWVWNEALAGC